MQKPLMGVLCLWVWVCIDSKRGVTKKKEKEREKREGVDEKHTQYTNRTTGRVIHTDARERNTSEAGIGAGTYHLREGVIFPSASIAVLSKPASKLDAAASKDAKNESPDEKAAACWTGRVGFQNALTVLPARKVTKSARKMFFIMMDST